MKEIKYSKSFEELYQGKNILIDANIVINELYDDSIIGDICTNALKKLAKHSNIFLSNVVISEIINKIIYTEFLTEMYYKLDEKTPINSEKEVNKIVSIINTYRDVHFSLDDLQSLRNTKFNLCFNLLNKDKYNRYLLKPYFDKTIKMYNHFKNTLKFKYLFINEDTYNKALNNFQCQMLGVNDAQHLQVAIDNKMDYLMTTDKDFSFVAQSYDLKVLKIDKTCLDSIGDIAMD